MGGGGLIAKLRALVVLALALAGLALGAWDRVNEWRWRRRIRRYLGEKV